MMELKWRVNDLNGSRPVVQGGNRIHVPAYSGMVITCAEAAVPVPAGQRMFFNGYQTWTHCPEFRATDRIRGLHGIPKFFSAALALDHFADYHFVNYPNRSGMLHGFSYCYFRDGGRYRLFASLDEHPGYTIFSYDSKHELLRIERDCVNIAVSGPEFHAFDLFYAEGSEDEVFDRWFEAMGIHNRPPELVGYSSWYNRYQKINAAVIREDLAGAERIFESGDLFQIDDGWESRVGDWNEADRRKFPEGLSPIVKEIHSKGFRAGLWLAPFVCQKGSELYRRHPDWLLRVRGKPWKNSPNWGGSYSLDIDNPGVTDHLRRVFRRVLDDWGFDLVKLDFLYTAAPLPTGDHGSPEDGPFPESRAGRMIRALRFLRELCGEKLILGCGVPVMPAFGLVDYCRVGSDVGRDWDDFPLMRLIHRERVSTRQSIDNTIFRRQLNGRAFGSDPDVFFLRDRNIRLSREEKVYHAAVNALLGSVWLTSDDLNAYDGDRIALYKSLARLRKAADIRIDPDTLTLRYRLDGEERFLTYPRQLPDVGEKR